jgi:hypothetical protein
LCGVLNSHVIDEPITEITLQEQIDGSVWDSSRRKASDDYPTFSPDTTDRGVECDSSKHVAPHRRCRDRASQALAEAPRKDRIRHSRLLKNG